MPSSHRWIRGARQPRSDRHGSSLRGRLLVQLLCGSRAGHDGSRRAYDACPVHIGGFAGPVSHDQTDTAHRFEAGYWFNSYVGLALDMTDLGEHMTHAQFTSVDSRGPSATIRPTRLIASRPAIGSTPMWVSRWT